MQRIKMLEKQNIVIINAKKLSATALRVTSSMSVFLIRTGYE